MKKVVLVAFIAVMGVVGIQAQNVGHINVAELVQAMPEAQSAEQTIKSQYEAKGADIKKAEDALKAEFQAFQEKVSKLTQTEIEAQSASLQAEQQALQEKAGMIDELRAKASEDIQKKEADLLEPIREKALTAIETVASNKGLSYVIDSSSGVLVIANGPDIIEDVKKQLGIN